MENNSSLVAFGTMSLAPQNAEGYTKEMPAHGRHGSLGRSQEGEVRFLEVSGFTYCQMTIEDFVYHYHDKSPEDKKKIVRDFILFIQSSKSRCAQKEAARKSHANSIAGGDSSAIVPLRHTFSDYSDRIFHKYSEYSIYDNDPDTASGSDTTQTSPERNRQVARMTIYPQGGHEVVALELEGNGMSRQNSIRLVDMLNPDGPTIESHDGGREVEPANDDHVPPNSVFSHASPVTSNYLASAPPMPPSLTLPQTPPCGTLASAPPPPQPVFPGFDAPLPPVTLPQPPRFDTALPDAR